MVPNLNAKWGMNKSGFSFRNLSVQFCLIVIGIPTLVLSAFGLYQIRSQTVVYERELDVSLENEASQLATSLSAALYNFDEETSEAVCEAALNKPEIVRISVTDLGDPFIAMAANGFDGQKMSKSAKTVRMPIFFRNEFIGEVEITATTRLLEKNIQALKTSIFLQIVILDLILGCVLIVVLLLRFVRPLQSLGRASEKIAAGDLDYPINVHRDDELGTLAENLVVMRNAVKEKVDSLEAEIRRHRQTAFTLEKTKNYLDEVIDAMPSTLIGLDIGLNVTQWNNKAEKMTGLAADHALGKPLEAVSPEFRPLTEKIRHTMMHAKPLFLRRKPRQTPEGVIYEDITVYPLSSEYAGGAVLRVDDVTEQERMEQMVVQSEKMMSIGGLAAGMAHEINNPLAGMMQNAQVVLRRIREDMPASETAAQKAGTTMTAIRQFMEDRGIARQLESIHAAGVRASGIVKNMLSFTRKDYSGKVKRDVGQILDKTLELARSDYNLKKDYDFKKIEVDRDYHPDTPQVLCETTKIQQVFFNLLKNAAEAMLELKPERSPRFDLRIYPNGSYVCIEIGDNGPGMSEAVRKRIFEPFFTTKEVSKGTGLGLSVSYFIITDNHNGKMTVSSQPGRGTRFLIQLPI